MAYRRLVWATLLVVLIHAAPATAAPAAERRGIEFARPGGEALLLDAYLPPPDEPRPGVIVVHGGSWVGGSRADVEGLARDLAAAGFAAFAIDYRLAPEHPYPAAVLDAQAAVRWVRSNARDLRVDPRALAVVGTSAGAHIAAMVGVLGDGRRDRGSRVRAAVSLSGPIDLTTLASDAPPAHRHGVQRLVDTFLGCRCPDRAEAASPISYVDPSDASLLLVGGSREVVGSSQARRMAAALAEDQVPHGVIEVPGTLHADQYLDVPVASASGPIRQAVTTFLHRWAPEPRSVPATGDPGPSPLARAGGLTGLALIAMLAALAPRALERRRSLHLVAADPAALARIDALGRTPARPSEIATLVTRDHLRPAQRLPA